MKFRRGAATAAVAATGAYAQTPAAYSSPSSALTAAPVFSSAPGVTYTTVTYDDCESASLETMITVTNGITVTYCPECEASASATPTVPGHTTVYTTTYLSLCPTGTVPVTYTITESCSEATPTWTPGPSHIPQGYTVTVKDCTVCHSDLSKTSTIPVTITEPCGCDANEGTTVVPSKTPAAVATTPTGKPVQQISDGQVQNPTGNNPVQQISDGQVQVQSPTSGAAAATSPAAGGSGAASSAAPYPSTSAGAVRPEASTSVPGVSYGNTTNITPAPYEGAASTAGVASLLLSILIGVLAFAL